MTAATDSLVPKIASSKASSICGAWLPKNPPDPPAVPLPPREEPEVPSPSNELTVTERLPFNIRTTSAECKRKTRKLSTG